ncbi:MAG: primosomal protein N' [Bacteroidota bacterium]|jgi:primosomal protein N' (replication factor Y)|nr:primosomal protein N' [Bacteroidota bacterium]
MTTRLYADIAVPGVPKDTLTYAVPEGLHEQLQPGVRVMVPLGRRLMMGFVIAVHDRMPDFALKAVQQVLDPAPVIVPPVMQICDWVHRYYVCGLGEALRAALPQGMDVDTARFVSLCSDDEELIARVVGKSRTKASMIDILRTGEIMTEEQLLAAVGTRSISAQLRELMMEGVLQIESVLERPAVRVKTVLAVRLLPEWMRAEKIAELMSIIESRAPKQANIIATLWKQHGRGRRTMQMTELVREAHASAAQVRALEDKGVVEVLDEEVTREWEIRFAEKKKTIVLTDSQRDVLGHIHDAVDRGDHRTMLLHGVTGSGKTQVYIEAIRHARATGKTALVLVPEIALTPQFVYRFREAFGKDVAVMHSRMSMGERFDAWRLTLAGEYRVVVGVRSSVFAPLSNLGIVVIDEEQDGSYKQSDTVPRYNGRDVAIMRGWLAHAPVLLGSATPSAESWQNAHSGKYDVLELPERIDGALLPAIRTVDMIEARKQGLSRGAFSTQLLEEIQARRDRGEACIVLHNRRGFAPHVECRDCGHTEDCDNCSISLTFHKDADLLRCHYCGATRRVPVVCPQCGGTDLDHIGVGTQRVEEDLRELLPEARIIRMDADSTKRKGSHDLILTSFAQGEADVLLGTQMVAKGLDFERVTLVGVISAEQSLLLPDFRAAERTMQLLTQVAGRAGRGATPGTVLLQTAQPEHPVLQYVLRHDYAGFMQEELLSRKKLYYPPYCRLVLLTFSGEDERAVRDAAHSYHDSLSKEEHFFSLYAPQPAMLARINRRHRWQLMLRIEKSRDSDGRRLGDILARAEQYYLRRAKNKSVHLAVDVDPHSMM